MLVVHADGLCEPVNPGGVACYGRVARRDGEKVGEDWGEVARGPGATNNVAEYQAVIAALEWLLGQGLETEPVLVRSDNQLVVRQVEGRYQVRSGNIRPLWKLVRKLAGRFAAIRFEWVPRERNEEADLLSRRAYGEALVRDRTTRCRSLQVEPAGDGVFRVRSARGWGWCGRRRRLRKPPPGTWCRGCLSAALPCRATLQAWPPGLPCGHAPGLPGGVFRWYSCGGGWRSFWWGRLPAAGPRWPGRSGGAVMRCGWRPGRRCGQ